MAREKGKSNYMTEDKDLVIVHYKDDATAGNGAVKEVFIIKEL